MNDFRNGLLIGWSIGTSLMLIPVLVMAWQR